VASGVGGIILDFRGNQELTYAWGLGIACNSKTEALLVFQALVLLKDKGIKIATVIGDSSIVVHHLHHESILNDIRLSRLIIRIQALAKEIETYIQR
jgi:ribonuclease HI